MKYPIIILLFAVVASAKERPNQCSTPSSDTCYAQAVQLANLLKSKMKNPDTFKLQKVAATYSGDICFRFTSENTYSQPVNDVAVYYRKGAPASVRWQLVNGENAFDHLLGDNLWDHLEDVNPAIQMCAGATPLDIERVRTAMSNSKQTDF